MKDTIIGSEFIKNTFKNQKILIIGDVMIDSYMWGKVERLSPEAPIPIINVKKREQRLGGAANVALNIQSLGAEPILCTVIGNDTEGSTLLKLLEEKNLNQKGILQSEGRITTIKHRIMSGSQHILRIDQEMDNFITDEETYQILNIIKKIIDEQHIDAVVFEDYDKGVITDLLIHKTIELCKKKEIPTIVDPKKRNFLVYKGASLMKPNFKELKDGLNKNINVTNINEIKNSVQQLIDLLNLKMAFITLSEHGVYFKDATKDFHIKAHKRDIVDVSGAGDTVASVVALSLGAKLPPKLLAQLSNLAGGIVCEKIGVVPITLDELINEAINLNILIDK